MTVVSPPFAVHPFHVYEVIWDAQFDHRGMQLLPGLRISSEDKAASETNVIDISATRNSAANSYSLAIPPQVHQASLTLQLSRSSPLTGRSININHFALRDLGPLNNQSDGDWFFNGSFDLIDTWPPPNWKTFGSKNGKLIRCTESPFDGIRCLRAVACDHIVFPSIQVKDRDVLHIRFQIRGEEGTVGVTAHHLDDSGRERLGGMTLVFPQKNLSLHSGKWQSVDLLVAALYPTRYIQVVISSQKKTLDLDAIEVRRVGPDFPWRSPVSENPSY